jgi:hypothetical protein
MIKKKFGGWTEQQMSTLARKLGHEGDMSQFNTYLASNPDKAAKLADYTTRAKNKVEGTQGMATGGKVDKKKTTKKEEKKTTSSATGGMKSTDITKTALTTPEKLITPVDTSKIVENKNQIIDPKTGQVGPASTVNPAQPGTTATATTAPTTGANTYDATKAQDDVQGVVDQTQAAQGTVSNQSKVEAATALPSADATVAGQMEKLLKQFEGGETPPWAAGAMRAAQTMMAQRGLGSSSMAGSAITQAAMESTLQIAVQDAATFSQFEMQNLNNRQQARVINAQSFLQMDLANLANEQQTALFKSQAMIQSMFTDQAAENAAKQFNATSASQTEQFFAQLKTQTSQFNAAQKNAMQQFNTGQKNAVSMFNAEQRNARDQFNATNRLIIDQSNAQWRRQITTTNNAEQNENNRINAQLATGLTTAAYNNLWQTERDIMAFAFTASENASQRAHELVLAKMDKDLVERSQNAALGEAAGSLLGEILDGFL